MKKLLSIYISIVVISVVFCVNAIAAPTEFMKMKEGALLDKIPSATVGSEVKLTDTSNIENGEFSISWDAIKGASSYSVRILFNINYMENNKGILNFLYEDEIKTTETTVNISGLEYGRRYTILVYGIDAEGKDMAVCDRLHVFTFPEYAFDDEETSSEKAFALTTEQIIIVIVAATVVLIAVFAVIVIVALKRPVKNKE